MFSHNSSTRRRQLIALGFLASTALLTGTLLVAYSLRLPSVKRTKNPRSIQALGAARSQGKLRRVGSVALPGRPTALAMLPDNRVVVGLTRDDGEAFLEIRDATAKAVEHRFSVKAPVYLLRVAPSGKELVYATDLPEGKLYRLDLTQMQTSLLAVADHPSNPWCRAAYSPDSQLLAFVTGGRTATLIDTKTGAQRAQIPLVGTGTYDDRIDSLSFSPQGDQLALGGVVQHQSVLQLWDVNTQQPSVFWVPGTGSLTYSPDGQFVAGLDRDGRYYVRRVTDGRAVRQGGDLPAIFRDTPTSWGDEAIHYPGRGGTLRFLPGTNYLIFAGDTEAGVVDLTGQAQWLFLPVSFPSHLQRYYGDAHAACSEDGKRLLLHDFHSVYFFERD
ncbi:WD40 repeat domain-containing protein [Armatimonas rosea]|nr:WD40 repeat domain-containing protein [Armatimonas rosea]